MTKILMTRSLAPRDKNYIKDRLTDLVGDSFELTEPSEYTEEGILAVAGDADVFLGPYVTEKILKEAKKLQLIQVPWTGMDTFNFSVVKGTDVKICNSHSNACSVAEFGVALLTDLLKKISYHDRKMRNGNWNRDRVPLPLTSEMISEQTVCILGYGAIGSRIGKILSGYGTHILAVTQNGRECPYADCGYDTEHMLKAVSMATVVVNTLPLTDITRSLIDAKFIENMKKGSYLVNVSRAAVMDEDAVFQALVSGHLAGFASDVWWNAPKRGETQSWPSSHNQFWNMEQVVLSPHRAGFAEGKLPHLDDAILNLAHFIKGEPLINIVDVMKEF